MRLSLDIGGTKIQIARLTDDLEVVKSEELETTRYRKGSVQFADDLADIIAERITPDVDALGFSFNCPIVDGVIPFGTVLGGPVNFPVHQFFGQKFGLPVVSDHDVLAHARAEAVFGVAKGVDYALMINFGTGGGVAYLENGRVVRGAVNASGLVGLQEVWVEEFGRYVMRDHLLSGMGISKIHSELAGEERTGQQIFEAYRMGDEKARPTVELFVKYFAKFLRDLTLIYNPRLVVLTGSMKKSAELFVPQTIAAYQDTLLPFLRFERFAISEVESAACRGVFC